MDTPTLTYNLGVVNFELEQLDAAASAFRRLTRDDSWRALAYYNLGLIEERRGRETAAQRHFEQARDYSTIPKLRRLAEGKLQPEMASRVPMPRRWYGLASFAGGHDDNVLLPGDQLIEPVTDQADQFGELLATAGRPLDSNRGATLDLTAYYRAHLDLDDFDFGSLSAALLWHRPAGEWRLFTGITGEAQFVGGDAYANVAGHRLQFERRQGSLSWRVRNDFNYYFGRSSFNFIDGWRNRTQLQVSNRLASARLKGAYEFELNDREDFESGDIFSSYSPSRHRIYAGASFTLGRRLVLDFLGGLRMSDYDDDNRFLDESGNLLEAARDQDTLFARIRMDYRLSQRWHVWSQYHRTDSDSDVVRYDYTSNSYMLGLETRF